MEKFLISITILLFVTIPHDYLLSQDNKHSYSNPKTYIVGGISVEGNFRFEKESIIKYTELKEGSEIKIPGEKISSLIKKLWSSKMFNDVKISIDKIDGKYIYLKINLSEVPMLSEVIFYGIKQSHQDDIVEEMGLKRGKMITDDLINQTKKHINNKYIKDGFLDCKTHIVIKNDTTMEYSSIMHIRVDRGDKIKIKDISIDGNEHLSDSEIRSLLEETKVKSFWNFFTSSKFIEEDYENDKKNVITEYKKLGFRDARILSDSIIKNDDNTISIKMNISEGNKYYFGSIKWLGNTVFDKSFLDYTLGIKKGDLYNYTLLSERLFGNASEEETDIHSLIMNKGHLFSQINPVETQIRNDSIDIEIHIVEGPIATVDKIIVSGNTRTNDEVIFRNIRTSPGQLFNKDLIQRTYRELAQLQYFDPENIGVTPLPNPQKGTVDIEYSLEEKSTSQIEFQGGWGAGRIVGTIGLSFNNFSFRGLFDPHEWRPVPLGDGQTLTLRAQASFGFQNYILSIVDPWIGGKRPYGFSFSINHSVQEEVTNYYSYETGDGRLSITSLNFVLTKRLGWPDDYFSLSHGISFQLYKLKNYQWNIYDDFDNGTSNNINYTISLSRNSSGPNHIFPTEGSDISVSLKMTPPFSLFNGVDYEDPNLTDPERFRWLEYYKFKFKGTWFNSIWQKLVLASRIEFGYMGAYNEKVGLSPFERFEMGGSGMAQFVAYDGREIIGLRGYKDGELTSSRGGAPIYSKFIIEFRYPIIMKPMASIYALIFAEGGNTFYSLEEFSPFEFRRSFGTGVRIFMPMFGLLGFDLGYGLDPVSSTGAGWEFHFTLGQQF